MKRIKVTDTPRIFLGMIHCGAEARSEGRAIDDIECKLLRDPEMAASWRNGWQGRDKELGRAKSK